MRTAQDVEREIARSFSVLWNNRKQRCIEQDLVAGSQDLAEMVGAAIKKSPSELGVVQPTASKVPAAEAACYPSVLTSRCETMT